MSDNPPITSLQFTLFYIHFEKFCVIHTVVAKRSSIAVLVLIAEMLLIWLSFYSRGLIIMDCVFIEIYYIHQHLVVQCTISREMHVQLYNAHSPGKWTI